MNKRVSGFLPYDNNGDFELDGTNTSIVNFFSKPQDPRLYIYRYLKSLR